MTTVPYRSTALLSACLCALLLGACAREGENKPASQVVAKVNGTEISIHQVNAVLGRMGPFPPQEAADLSKRVLEQVIDQELIVEKAKEKKLDRNPQVLQAIEAARRDVLARAYLEEIASSATRPTAQEIKEFFDANPALFKDRRIFTVREIFVPRRQELHEALQREVDKGKSISDIAAHLRSGKVAFSTSAAAKSAEQVALELLPDYQRLRDGQTVALVHDGGALVVHMVSAELQPLDEKTASPLIEAFLLSRQRAELMKNAVRHERSIAKVDYLGDFAKLAKNTDAPQSIAPQPMPTARESAGVLSPEEQRNRTPHIEKGLSSLN